MSMMVAAKNITLPMDSHKRRILSSTISSTNIDTSNIISSRPLHHRILHHTIQISNTISNSITMPAAFRSNNSSSNTNSSISNSNNLIRMVIKTNRS